MFKITAKQVFLLLIFYIPNTIFSMSILVIMNGVVSGRQVVNTSDPGLIFFAIVVVSFLMNVYFHKKIILFANHLIYENELRIMERFQSISLQQLEQIGSPRIYGAVEDMRMLVFLPGLVTTGISIFFTLLICVVYFFWVSIPSMIFVVLLIAVMISVFLMVNRKVARSAHQLRKENDAYFKLLEDFIKGFKEFKLSLVRRTNFNEKFFFPNRASVRDTESFVSGYLTFINLVSQYGFYLVIGCVIFVLPYLKMLNRQEVSAFVIILLFLRGPINSLMSMQTFFTKAVTANKRINKFMEELEALSATVPSLGAMEGHGQVKSLSFKNISYKYDTVEGGDRYALQHLNFSLEGGEVVFIIGGNGSGKSTFINILTGIYTPASGKIFLNGREVQNTSQYYRNHISAIYSDHHLFSENYENYSLVGNDIYKQLLAVMELDSVVDDTLDAAARRRFSKGQAKRMALIFAMLEDRQVLVLDEWAADQDPHFRKFFYEQLVPRFREKGKTVIAVTHDDAYFKHADRVIRFEYGNIVNEAIVS
ncbi:cyclic peptide export ABC transporter [[Flexibacter] sp. ATCC 35208]|uniref:cyclic peptide export ABC transporter n=1 Tax=[Flexibacter] sp. ATCC 35208 TaxID=1936242 RepID=UPI0009CA3665|nr:cyclic peptide export ABC transporter [[Flexibacter] sp. ATCC 35208]OMP77280.1 hypothetical protein BW716_20655 [[Flexibacter] sp. ATCC 35208]